MLVRFLFYIVILFLLIFIPFLKPKNEPKVVSYSKKTAINVTLVEKPTLKKVRKKTIKKKKAIKRVKPKNSSKPKDAPKKTVKPLLKKPNSPKILKKKEPLEEPSKIVKELNPKSEEKSVVKELEEVEELEEVVKSMPSKEEILASKKELYFASIYQKISKYKKYPKKAKKLKQEGDIKVRFIIDSKGRVSDFEIIDKSDFRLLNKAVKKMFKRLKTFDAPPSELSLPLEISIIISYRLK